MQRTSRRIVGSVAPRLPWARAAHGRSGSFPPVPRGDSRGARARARGAAGVARDQGRGGVVHVSGARKICLLHVARASDPLPTLFPWYRVAASPSPPQHAGMRGPCACAANPCTSAAGARGGVGRERGSAVERATADGSGEHARGYG
jgi:hypothetical protein